MAIMFFAPLASLTTIALIVLALLSKPGLLGKLSTVSNSRSWNRYNTEYMAAETADTPDWTHTTRRHLYTMDISPTSFAELDVAASVETDEEVAQVLLQSYRQRAFRDGDVIIGVLLPIHRPASAKSYPVRCSIIWEEYGMHRMEQLIWTIEEINREQKILPGVTLGYDIRDTCWTTQVALERTMDFIKSKAGDDHCSTGSAYQSPLAAVLGAASSEISVAVQEVAQMFDIPQVDFGSTSPQLSDKSMFRLFARVIPSDQEQATMLVDVIRHFGWQYVHGIYTEGNYGEKGYEAFRDILGMSGICLASTRKFLLRVPDNHDQYAQLVTDLAKHPDTHVIVCFCDGLGVRALFRTLTKHNLNGSYVVLGSDGWNVRKDIIRGFESAASGGLSVTHWSPRVPNFEERFYALTPHTVPHERNPWFAEYWAQKHGCLMSSSALLGLTASPFSRKTTRQAGKLTTAPPTTRESLNSTATNFTTAKPVEKLRFCTGNETTQPQDRLKQEAKLGFVVNSVYAVAHAISRILKRNCFGKAIRACEHLYPIVNGSMLFQSLREVSFTNYANEDVRFDANMDGVGKYQLWNFQSVPGTNPPLFRYMAIGEWEKNRFEINDSIVFWPTNISSLGENGVPESFCSKPCNYDQIKVIPNVALPCCWDCLACPTGAYVSNGTKCVTCKPGWAPNEMLTDCEKVKIRFRNLSEIESVVVVTIASVGMIVALCVWFAYYFTKRLSIPRAISLVGILVTFTTVFSLLARPTLLTCYFSRILPPIAQSILFSPIFNRANAMVRIVNSSRKLIIDRRPRFISTNSQIALTCFIIGAQCTVVVMMLIWEAADVKIVYPSYNVALLVCRSTFFVTAIPLAFNGIIMFATLIYALRTRKIKQMIRSDESVYYPIIMGSNAMLTFASILFYYAMGTEDQLVASAHQLLAGFSTTVMFVLPLFSGPEQVDFDEQSFAEGVRNDLRQQQSSIVQATAGEDIRRVASLAKRVQRRKSVSMRLWDTMTVMREVAASTKMLPEGSMTLPTNRSASGHKFIEEQRSAASEEKSSGDNNKAETSSNRRSVKKRFFKFSSSAEPSQTSSSGSKKEDKVRRRGAFVLVTAPSDDSGSPNREISATPEHSAARMSKRGSNGTSESAKSNTNENEKSSSDHGESNNGAHNENENDDVLLEELQVSYDDTEQTTEPTCRDVVSPGPEDTAQNVKSKTSLALPKGSSSMPKSSSKDSIKSIHKAVDRAVQQAAAAASANRQLQSSQRVGVKVERVDLVSEDDPKNQEICRTFSLKSSDSNSPPPDPAAKLQLPSSSKDRGLRSQPPLPPPPLPSHKAKGSLPRRPPIQEEDHYAMLPGEAMEYSEHSSAVVTGSGMAMVSDYSPHRSYDEVFAAESPGVHESDSADSMPRGGAQWRQPSSSSASAVRRRQYTDQITNFSINRAQPLHAASFEPVYGAVDRPVAQHPQPQQPKRVMKAEDANLAKQKATRL